MAKKKQGQKNHIAAPKPAQAQEPEPIRKEEPASRTEYILNGLRGEDGKKWRNILWIVLIGVAFFWALQNWTLFFSTISWLTTLIAPLLVGCAIAFVVNVPMSFLERLLPFRSKLPRLCRAIAMTITLILILNAIFLVMAIVLPNVTEAALSLAGQIPGALERLWASLEKVSVNIPEMQEYLDKARTWLQGWSGKLIAWLSDGKALSIINMGTDIIGSIFSGVSSFLMSAMFALYVLVQKEKLTGQSKRCIQALLPTRLAKGVLRVCSMSYKSFASFLSYQCLEALILGSMFVLVLLLFKMPYALLIGVLIALTALVPIVGAFIGCGLGFVMIAIVNIQQACIFVVLFLILQQIEGNLIYPHVVGGSVGLPSLITLAAVVVGGRLMGVAGMLLFIPIVAVAYTLLQELVRRRLTEKRKNGELIE